VTLLFRKLIVDTGGTLLFALYPDLRGEFDEQQGAAGIARVEPETALDASILPAE